MPHELDRRPRATSAAANSSAHQGELVAREVSSTLRYPLKLSVGTGFPGYRHLPGQGRRITGERYRVDYKRQAAGGAHFPKNAMLRASAIPKV